MKKFENEIWGYVVRNALDHGKSDPGKVVPKLFQHGMKRDEIPKLMPFVKEICDKVNGYSDTEKKELLEIYSKFIKEREKKEDGELPELPNVKDKFVSRIAPFPSGAIHLGNAKTFIINALYAEKYKGKTILVIDDTIGSEKKPIEKSAYMMIQDSLDWLGVKYQKKIVYKSDRLETYYRYAEKLIKLGKAYVDFTPVDKMRELRANGIESGERELPVEIQLKRWKEMFKLKDGEAVLRLKTSMQHPNPAFRDRILFKISTRAHPRVGKKYRVWPSLEMSWAVDDHLLGITHIIRGNDLMMETEMEKYIWDIFGWDHPTVIHTGLVNIKFTGAKISKSKSREEVLSGEFIGWDDPRTWSILSLERRGITPTSIKEFVRGIGLNKQDITIPIETLYSINRQILDEKTNRYYFVEDPIKLNIEGKPDWESVEIPIHPDKPEKREVKLGDVKISSEDYNKYNGKEIRLLHLYNIDLKKKIKLTTIENKSIPKVQWVSDSVKVSILMPDGTWKYGEAESSIKDLKVGEVIQFERFGFCRFDCIKKGSYNFWLSHK